MKGRRGAEVGEDGADRDRIWEIGTGTWEWMRMVDTRLV